MNAQKTKATSTIRIPRYRPFITEEQRLCTKENGNTPYWFKEHAFCRNLLELGADPEHFELIRAYFPVARTAITFEFPMTEAGCPHWLAISFYAGWQFAKSQRKAAEQVLPTIDNDAVNAVLAFLEKIHGENAADPNTITDAFRVLWSHTPKEIPFAETERRFLAASLNSFASGLSVGVSGTNSASFGIRIQLEYDAPALPLHVRAIIASAAEDFRKPFAPRLEHPLLRCAAAQYPTTPLERAAILPFFHRELWRIEQDKVKRGFSDVETAVWVRNAVQYGKQLRKENPELLTLLKEDLGRNRFAAALRCCRAVKRTRSTLAELTRAAIDWYVSVYGTAAASYLGAELDRTVRIADWAIWIAVIKRQT